MVNGLRDKVGIVTGASRGIGKAIAQRLAAEGMRLVIAARSAEALAEVAAECENETVAYTLDLRVPEAPPQLIACALERFGRIDLLVNNAGETKRGDFLHLTEEDWQDGFALKFFSGMRCARAVWPHLVQSSGVIVNIVGVGGRTGTAEFAIGGAANAGCLNLTKVLADRGIQDGVRVCAINPGSIATERLQARIRAMASERGITVEQAASEMACKLGVARFGTPAEIAAAVVFLASPEAAYCQGAILDVDGGQTRTL